MTTRTKTLASLLAGAVVLSSGAYALGSQTGGGNADAAATRASRSGAANGTTVSRGRDRGARGFDRRGDFGLSALASRLGVSPAALREALQAIRTSKTPEQRRAEIVQALATALDKPVADVRSALESLLPKRDTRKADVAAAIAKELGVETAKVQAAFDRLRQDFRDRSWPRPRRRGDRRDAVVDAIASATGTDATKVRAALAKVRQTLGDRHDRRDDVRQKLADALEVTPAQLDAAFQKVRGDQRNAFAAELARRLNIDVAKVQSALQALGLGDSPRDRLGGRVEPPAGG